MAIQKPDAYAISGQPVGLSSAVASHGLYGMNSLDAVVNISVRRLPEGVWLATSDDLPGLVVETDTRDEAINLSRELAIELMELQGNPERFRFAFLFAQ